MHTTRNTLVLSLVAALAVAVPASAAPKAKVSCNLVQDAKQDTFLVRAQDGEALYGPQEDGFDIVSGDVASDAKTLTGVLRVAKLATAVGSAPRGIDYRVNFVLPGQDGATENFFLNARVDDAGTQKFLLGHVTRLAPNASTTVKLADGKGVFDLKKNEVRISVPFAAVKMGSYQLKPGTKILLDGLDQTASRLVAVNPQSDIGTATFADVAASDKTYVAGSRSCVVPGK